MSRKGCPNKKSKKILFICLICKKEWFDFPCRVDKKNYCSKLCANKSIKRIETTRKRSIGNNWGSLKVVDDDFRKKISKIHKGRRNYNKRLSKLGNKNPMWKGGITPETKRIRESANIKWWRKSVFERDSYTCQFCGKKGGKLNADHIKSFSKYPSLRFILCNGRTLCNDCHRKTDNYGNRKLPTEQK